MNLFLDGYLSQRIDQISKTLLETNGEYARADHKRKVLWENVHPIMSGNTDIAISGGDRLDFSEYFEQLTIMSSIEKHILYRQGYMDCVKALKALGIL